MTDQTDQADPLKLFDAWYREAQNSPAVDADAMALATASRDGYPSVRILYFRRLIGTKFCFFTNYGSRKGEDLEQNPRAAAVFMWHMIGRQVNLRGSVTKLSAEESDEYFYKRTAESQLSAATSRQSRRLKSREQFAAEIEANRKKFGEKILRPENWGGYGLDPARIEFWTKGEHRRHERDVFIKSATGWSRELLYP